MNVPPERWPILLESLYSIELRLLELDEVVRIPALWAMGLVPKMSGASYARVFVVEINSIGPEILGRWTRWLAERSRSEFLRAARLVVKARTSDMFVDSSGGWTVKGPKVLFLKKKKAPGVRVKVSLGSRSHTWNRCDHKILFTWVGAAERVIRMSCQVPVLQKRHSLLVSRKVIEAAFVKE